MTDHHAGEVHALFAEDFLLGQPRLAERVGVSGNRRTRAPVGLGGGPQHTLDSFSDSGLVGGAFEHSGLHSGSGDALLDVQDKHVDHHLRSFEDCARSAQVKIQRNIVVGIDAGGHDNVDGRPFGDLLNAGDIAPETDHSQIDHGIHAARLQLVQTGHSAGDALVFVAPLAGIVLPDFRIEHKDMLVHQCDAELGGVDGAVHCWN